MTVDDGGFPESYPEAVKFMFLHWGPCLLLASMFGLVLFRAAIGEVC